MSNLYANFQISWWSCDHFSAPFRGLYLPNVWSYTLQTSKRHTFRVSAFQRYHWFGTKLFTIACSQNSRKLPKNAKMLFFKLFSHLSPPTAQNSGIFTTAPVITSTLTVRRQNRGDPSSLYRTYGALQVLQKTYSFWFGLNPPTGRSRSKSAHKCIPYNGTCMQNFIEISWDLAVRGPKTCFFSNNKLSWCWQQARRV